MPVHGDLAECLSVFHFLLCDFFVNGGINPCTHFTACRIAELACRKQGNIRRRAKDHLLFFPVNADFMYQSFELLGLVSRYSPELSPSLKVLSVGLSLRIAVSVSAIAGVPFVQRTVRPPIKLPKTTDIKKPGNPYQDSRVNLTTYFYNALRLAEMS